MSDRWWRVLVSYGACDAVPHIYRCAAHPGSLKVKVLAGPFDSLYELLEAVA